MRVAAIDCGTNTLLCLIADINGERITRVEDHAEIVRLGEGLDRTGELTAPAMARALAALDRYVARIAALGCDRVIGVGTESLRPPRNGHVFVQEARALLAQVAGEFHVIDGE